MKHTCQRLLAAVASLGFSGWVLAVNPGEPAPEFKLPGLAADEVNLAAYRGKLVYLDFWASWCGPCKQSFPWMNQLQSRYAAQGLQVLTVNLDTRAEDARRFLMANPGHFPVGLDPQGQVPKSYAILGMPSSVLIAPDGKVLWTHRGFRAEEAAELEATISRHLPNPNRQRP